MGFFIKSKALSKKIRQEKKRKALKKATKLGKKLFGKYLNFFQSKDLVILFNLT